MAEKSWLKVSLTIESELAESVSEVFSRFAPNGVVIESISVEDDPFGQGKITDPFIVNAYIPIDHEIEQKRQKLEESLWYLGRIKELPEAQYEIIQQENWMEAWKQHYHPVRIGNKLVILPAWAEIPDEDLIPVRIDPGMAFGTGTHPTTQLILRHLEDYVETGQNLIDVGCGSGILSIAAIKLGAGYALAVDIDQDFSINADRNSELNSIEDQIEYFVGSVTEILAGDYKIQSAPLVLANILDPVLVRLLDNGLADLVEPGGTLILSGILEERIDQVIEAVKKTGLEIIAEDQIDDWMLLAANKL